MTQAIVTKYLGPTSYKGGRIKATAWAGSLTIPYPHDYNRIADAHAVAAKALVEKLGWKGRYVCGGLPNDQGYVFVDVNSNDSSFTVESNYD